MPVVERVYCWSKPFDLLEGRSKISVSSSMGVVGSKKNELDKLLANYWQGDNG